MTENLYDPALLADLKLIPGSGLQIRPLRRDDYHKGYVELLEQLTEVGDYDEAAFQGRFDAMRTCKNHYFVTVIEDIETGKIIAASTLAVELKFIRNCALRGRLEDVVVNEKYRGKNLGKTIIRFIIHLAKKIGCYKLSLDCKDALIKFYEGSGFKCEPGNSNTMIIRL